MLSISGIISGKSPPIHSSPCSMLERCCHNSISSPPIYRSPGYTSMLMRHPEQPRARNSPHAQVLPIHLGFRPSGARYPIIRAFSWEGSLSFPQGVVVPQRYSKDDQAGAQSHQLTNPLPIFLPLCPLTASNLTAQSTISMLPPSSPRPPLDV